MVKNGFNVINKILVQGNWYSLVSSHSVYEIKYENQILRFSNEIFPDFHCIKFKSKINSIYGNCIPDLVLIHKEYRDWYVVEVELEHHSLHSHVLDQVRSMHHGEYNKHHINYIMNALPNLDKNKLNELLLQRPKTMVVVPISKVSWRESLYQFQTKVMCIEVWEDDKGIPLLRIDGDTPDTYEEMFLTKLELDKSISRLLRVMNAASLPSNGLIQISVNGETSDWRIISTGGGKWLNPDGKWPLPTGLKGSFALKLNDSGDYILEIDNE